MIDIIMGRQPRHQPMTLRCPLDFSSPSRHRLQMEQP